MKWGIVIISMMVLFSWSACGKGKEEYAHQMFVYYINNEETGILTREYQTNIDDAKGQIDELLRLLKEIPEKLEYKSPLAGAFALLGYDIAGGTITLDFDSHYTAQPIVTEILVRAALVRTLNQVEGIDHIVMTIRGEPFHDGTGNIVGSMNAEMFIDNIGNELNSYARTNLRLYFADAEDDSLKVVSRNDVIYHSSVAIEKLIVETLLEGPGEAESVRATMNPATRLLGVTTTDGTCYVNLDESFIQLPYDINAEMMIYSLTNSLIELPNVNRVRIAINGETPIIFETINLATFFERNLDIVK